MTAAAITPGSQGRHGSHPHLGAAEAAHRDLAELAATITAAVEADGGTFRIVHADPATGAVTYELAGACGTCAVAAGSTAEGIERVLRSRLDWVRTVTAAVVTDDPGVTGIGGWVQRREPE